MLADRSQGVCIIVIWQLREIGMSLIQHGRCCGLLLGERADPSHSIFFMSPGLGSCLRSHCERIGLAPREDKGGLERQSAFAVGCVRSRGLPVETRLFKRSSNAQRLPRERES